MSRLATSSGSRLSILVAACLMSVALPAGNALAQKVKNKTPAATATTNASDVSVVIPTIDTNGSNVDEATLRDIFSGNLTAHADALAGLDADSIAIPEITLSATTTVDGEDREVSVTMSDLLLSDVEDGVAASVSLAGITLDAGDEGSAEFGTMTTTSFNIAGMLGFYGLVDAGGQTERETIYENLSFEGGSFESEEATCTVGGISVAEFKARPLQTPFMEIIGLAEAMEAQGDDVSPELVGKAMRMYVDMFTAFESSPMSFGGFECSGLDEEGRDVSFSVASGTTSGMAPGIYPSISLVGLDISVKGDGTVQVGNFTIKQTDFAAPIAAIMNAPDAIDEAWLTANARALIPAFDGFAFGDVVVDVPDPDADGERIKASVGSFDLSLASYINGIPSDLLAKATNIVVDLPKDTDDEQLQTLIDLGVASIDAGFTIDTAWNAAQNTIRVNDITLTGADLATITLAGTINNATELLFDLDQNNAIAAAMGLAVSHLKLDLHDAGLSDIILAIVAEEQGTTPATMRPILGGLAEGTVVGMLAGAAEAQKVGSALSAFISGKAKYLNIDMKAKQMPGLGMMDFLAAEDDPTQLIGKVNITATSK